MSDIQMPELPAGMRWLVKNRNYDVEWDTNICLQMRGFFRWKTVNWYPHRYSTSDRLAIEARRVLAEWAHEQKRQDVLGTYPPKTL